MSAAAPSEPRGVKSLLEHNRKLKATLLETRQAHERELRVLRLELEKLNDTRENPEQVQQLNAQLQVTEKELAEARARLGGLEIELEHTQSERDALLESLEDASLLLEAQVAAGEKERQQLERQLEDMRHQLEAGQGRENQLQRERSVLLNNVSALRGELAEAAETRALQLKQEAENRELKERLVAAESSVTESAAELEAARLAQQRLRIESERKLLSLKEEFESQDWRVRCLEFQELNAELRLQVDKLFTEAESHQKALQQAREQAFQNRNKLLEAYNREESAEILKAGLEKARQQAEAKSQELAQVKVALEASHQRYRELEEQAQAVEEKPRSSKSLSTFVEKLKSLSGSRED